MTQIIEEANNYQPKETMGNIAELQRVPINIELKKETRKNNEGEDYEVMFIEVDGRQYRVPGVVLGCLKAINKEVPNMNFFKVIKTGSGKENTKYQVIPIQ